MRQRFIAVRLEDNMGGRSTYIQDEEPGYRAIMLVNGDFGDRENRDEYAAAIAAALNAARESIPVSP